MLLDLDRYRCIMFLICQLAHGDKSEAKEPSISIASYAVSPAKMVGSRQLAVARHQAWGPWHVHTAL